MGFTKEQYSQMVYDYVRDSEQLNKLLNFKKETSPEGMALYVAMTLDDFNTTPPQSSFSYESFPSMSLFIYGAVIQLLISNGILQSRNRLSYSDGGVSVQVSDKAGEYSNWISLLVNKYESKARAIKEEANILGGFEGFGPGSPRTIIY